MSIRIDLYRLAVAVALIGAARADDSRFVLTGVYNEAHLGSEPGVVVPGSVILIASFGLPIGPAAETNIDGTVVTVAVNGTARRAATLAAEPHWVRALVPEDTPLGGGSITVSYNGETSVPYPVRVLERRFLLYDGSWCGPSAFPERPAFCVPRAVQNIGDGGDAVLNGVAVPAKPGQSLKLWGTGLGDAGQSLQVFVGNQRATVIYAGRSGCCAGIDEIMVETPEGVYGCGVPVWVRYGEDGSSSNDLFVAIAPGEGACSDPNGLSQREAEKLARGDLVAAQFIARDGPTGNWSASFGKADATRVIPFGTCKAYDWGAPLAVEVLPESLWDAGSLLSLETPGSAFVARPSADHRYNGDLRGNLQPGEYAIGNGDGGSEVAGFRATFSLPRRDWTWTNRDEMERLTPGVDITVQWGGGGPESRVIVIGTFASDGEISSGFQCYERADKQAFTVPGAVLERFRARSPGANEFQLSLGQFLVQRLAIPGIDVSELLVPAAVASQVIPLAAP